MKFLVLIIGTCGLLLLSAGTVLGTYTVDETYHLLSLPTTQDTNHLLLLPTIEDMCDGHGTYTVDDSCACDEGYAGRNCELELCSPGKCQNVKELFVHDEGMIVDTVADPEFCECSGADPHLMAVVFKERNSEDHQAIRLRIFDINDTNHIDYSGPSILLSEQLPTRLLAFPKIICLDNYNVLVIWASVNKFSEYETYIFKGLIYNIQTKVAGDVHDLSPEFESSMFSSVTIGRVGLSSDNRVFLTYTYMNTTTGDNYYIKGQMLTYSGSDITLVGTARSLYPGSPWIGTRGTQFYSFPETDKFLILFIQSRDAVTNALCHVFQVDETEPNDFKSLTYTDPDDNGPFYTASSPNLLDDIYVSGIHGNSITDSTSKVLINWETSNSSDKYALDAYLSDSNELAINSSFLFDPTVETSDVGQSDFIENHYQAWVLWHKDIADYDIYYNVIDLSGDSAAPVYSKQLFPRGNNIEFQKNSLMALANGDIIFLIHYTEDGTTDYVKLYYYSNQP